MQIYCYNNEAAIYLLDQNYADVQICQFPHKVLLRQPNRKLLLSREFAILLFSAIAENFNNKNFNSNNFNNKIQLLFIKPEKIIFLI